MNISTWHNPAVIADNHFVNKSLSCWSFNVAVGCAHACRFCYVPDVSTIRMKPTLAKVGVVDPDAEWGNYVFPRKWDENAFRASLRRAEHRNYLNADGNRAVMLCTTTDPYQALPSTYGQQLLHMVERALTIILEESTINVRILTRSPLARTHFPLYTKFGPRLMFGMSIPTLDAKLARVYEPNAPDVRKRLETLRIAKDDGLNIYAAIAPTYPEMGEAQLIDVFTAIATLAPWTIFHEPINIRAENVARIQKHAESLGVQLRADTWATKESWAMYSMAQMQSIEWIASKCGFKGLHLWPDKELPRHVRVPQEWFSKWWNRISEWPK